MNPHEILRRFPGASKSLLAANAHDYGSGKPHATTPHHPRSITQPQPNHQDCQLARPRQPEKASPARLHLRIVSVRKRLCDPDNIVPKWTIDCLRYCRIIPDDSPEHITLEVAQRKVAKGEVEHTEVELTLPEPPAHPKEV